MNNYIYTLKNPPLDIFTIRRNEALFHNANGYLGVRYDFEEGYPEDMDLVYSQFINGFYEYTEVDQEEKLYGLITEKQTNVNLVNTQHIFLTLEDEKFSMYQGEVVDYTLEVNMKKGTTTRCVHWKSPSGKEVLIKIIRMASFVRLPLFFIQYQVTSLNFSGDVLIESVHDGNVFNYTDPLDPRIADEANVLILPETCEIIDGVSYINSRTPNSGLDLYSAVENQLSFLKSQEFLIEPNKAICRMHTSIKEKETLTLNKYSVLCDSIRFESPQEEARLQMEMNLKLPVEILFQEQENFLSDYWAYCEIEINGDDELDLAMKYNLYQLLQSVSKDSYGNISPKGLSGDGYEGHYFWDTEMFVQPFFTATNPEYSKDLISFRHRTLDAARTHARIMGHKRGALFPWRTISGAECSGYFPSGSAQYHINGDIVYSIVEYYLATMDEGFLLTTGAEIILESALLWIEAGNFSQNKFYINNVTGPDEYTCLVNNNYYTNLLAKYNLEWAGKLYEKFKNNKYFYRLLHNLKISLNDFSVFEKAASLMYLPHDENLNISAQDDSFLTKHIWDISSIPKRNFPLLLHYHPLHIYRQQICKQADTVMAHYLLEDSQSLDIIRNSFLYYEKITTHDSSLSKPIFAIVAARLGMEQKSVSYFGDSAKVDLKDLHKNTKDGLHIASMAGSYLTILYGFSGFRMKEEFMVLSPMLPKTWTHYHLRIQYKGSRISIDVYQNSFILKLISGKPVKIRLYDVFFNLRDTIRHPIVHINTTQ